MIGKRRSRGRQRHDPDLVLMQAREVVGGLLVVLDALRKHLDELETEVRRQPVDTEEA